MIYIGVWTGRMVTLWLAFFLYIVHILLTGNKDVYSWAGLPTATDVIRSDALAFIYTHPLGSDGQ